MNQPVFKPADLLLPRTTDIRFWSVVACDQFTSQPEYWRKAEQITAHTPSTLHLVLPECRLEDSDAAQQIESIHNTMWAYLDTGVLREVKNSYLYLERTLSNGQVRRGLIGALDLEQYDYRKGANSLIRATEGTVPERLPPRIAIRQGAPLELPHVMVLIDDLKRRVIEPLSEQKDQMTLEYSGELMLGGGSVQGWRLSEKQAAAVNSAISDLKAQSPMVFAMGDGNHSFAAAKACFEQLKTTMPETEWRNHPARYALAELVNIYDDSLNFEPIHRLVRTADPAALLAAMTDQLGLTDAAAPDAQRIEVITAEGTHTFAITRPLSPLTVGSVQKFLDDYAGTVPLSIDYIHGDDTLRTLAVAGEDLVGILLPPMDKRELFPGVIADGALPRKTFSMGHAEDKRYYLECRKIL